MAKDYYTAKKARDLLKIDWDYGPSRAIKDLAQVEEGLRQAAKKTGAIVSKAGNVENPLDGAVKKVSAEYMLPFLAHATLEPVNCSASITNGECHVWGPIQFQQGASGVAAAI